MVTVTVTVTVPVTVPVMVPVTVPVTGRGHDRSHGPAVRVRVAAESESVQSRRWCGGLPGSAVRSDPWTPRLAERLSSTTGVAPIYPSYTFIYQNILSYDCILRICRYGRVSGFQMVPCQ
jgi:hypothetical protein